MTEQTGRGSLLEVLAVFGRLGLTSFGGPVAHLGYFRQEFVERRRWLDERSYADVVALCQFLPGPASSQVGIAVGIKRAGILGGVAAWLGFTIPSAIALILFAYGVTAIGDVSDAGWLHGLKVVAVAVVGLAVWGMARTLCPDRPRATMAIVAAIALLAWQTPASQIAVIGAGGLVGWRLLREDADQQSSAPLFPVGRTVAIFCLTLFATTLIALPLIERVVSSEPLQVFDSFFRSGSLVFGGGHVVLPLLQAEVVPPAWVTNEEFIAGYGAAQAVPGPLFTFSAYLGTILDGAPTGWTGGLFALGAIYIPSFLLAIGAAPFWDWLRAKTGFGGVMRGVNAAVVGLLAAALYDPVWVSAIERSEDLALALAAFGLLAFWKWPPWLVVVLSALGGQMLASI
jgi:chromate transporter